MIALQKGFVDRPKLIQLKIFQERSPVIVISCGLVYPFHNLLGDRVVNDQFELMPFNGKLSKAATLTPEEEAEYGGISELEESLP
ncbi:MAG: hypothetical protein NVS2B14_05600 [Chamaesiphon sp.]